MESMCCAGLMSRDDRAQIHNGMTAIEHLHSLLHGEKGTYVPRAQTRAHRSHLPPVAFGTICQLVLDGRPTEELDRYIAFMLSVDLPITFEMLGIPKVTDDDIRRVAKLSCAPGETIWNMQDPVTEELVFGAIKAADAVGREFIARVKGKQL